MAHKRMFSLDITESDAFSDMPLSSQALYFHLGMNADDDGFINNPKKIARSIGASNDDLGLLVAKRFVIAFESGVVVIKHWRINNTVRSDRYNPTVYQEEYSRLKIKDNNAYTLENDVPDLLVSQVATDGIPLVAQWDTQTRIEEDRIEEKEILSGKPDFSSETSEIVGYLNERIGSQFKPGTKATRRHINARLSEGFTVADFKAVIDKKAKDWLKDPRMSQYLRPETLFGTKFEGYLQDAKAVRGNADDFRKYR